MKNLPKILLVSLFLALTNQLVLAESTDGYVDALSTEAEQTSMKANKAAVVTGGDSEPEVVPATADDIDTLSREVSDRLEQILTGSSSKITKKKKIAAMVSSAVKKGHEIDAIQNVVNEAIAEISQQENLDIKTETLEFTEKTVSEIVGASKDIAQGDPNDPYIKSLNIEVNKTTVLENDGKAKETSETTSSTKNVRKANVKNTETFNVDMASLSSQENIRTIVVLKGDSLSTIAGKIYGSVDKYPHLYNANKDILKNPDLILVGQILKVPPLP